MASLNALKRRVGRSSCAFSRWSYLLLIFCRHRAAATSLHRRLPSTPFSCRPRAADNASQRRGHGGAATTLPRPSEAKQTSAPRLHTTAPASRAPDANIRRPQVGRSEPRHPQAASGSFSRWSSHGCRHPRSGALARLGRRVLSGVRRPLGSSPPRRAAAAARPPATGLAYCALMPGRHANTRGCVRGRLGSRRTSHRAPRGNAPATTSGARSTTRIRAVWGAARLPAVAVTRAARSARGPPSSARTVGTLSRQLHGRRIGPPPLRVVLEPSLKGVSSQAISDAIEHLGEHLGAKPPDLPPPGRLRRNLRCRAGSPAARPRRVLLTHTRKLALGTSSSAAPPKASPATDIRAELLDGTRALEGTGHREVI